MQIISGFFGILAFYSPTPGSISDTSKITEEAELKAPTPRQPSLRLGRHKAPPQKKSPRSLGLFRHTSLWLGSPPVISPEKCIMQ